MTALGIPGDVAAALERAHARGARVGWVVGRRRVRRVVVSRAAHADAELLAAAGFRRTGERTWGWTWD